MKVYRSQEDLQKQKEYLQSQCRKAGLTIATQKEELLALQKILNLKDKEIKDLKEVNAGLGIYILTTNQGLMTDKKARSQNIGGEVLVRIF